MSHVAKLFSQILVFVHIILIAWGIAGLVEYALPAASLGLQDAGFPPGLQFLHFASLLVTGVVFVGGYLTRWRHTPFATVTMYAVLATICFIETVDFEAFGGGLTRFIPMTLEYITYVGISTFLLRSSTVRRRFSLEAARP